jgi:hypothetical protein
MLTFVPMEPAALVHARCDTEGPQRFDVFVNGAAEPAMTLVCAGAGAGDTGVVRFPARTVEADGPGSHRCVCARLIHAVVSRRWSWRTHTPDCS